MVLTTRQISHLRGLPVENVSNLQMQDVPEVTSGGENILVSRLHSIGAIAALTEDTAYFVYMGTLKRKVTALRVYFTVTTAGVGAQTAEVGLFSTPTAPNRLGQTLTKLVASGVVTDMLNTGVHSNSTSFALDIAAGIHLWAGLRTAMAGTEPWCWGLNADMSYGRVLSTATAGALTAGTTFTGALITPVVQWQAPALTVHCS
jgi:hypothetical protein